MNIEDRSRRTNGATTVQQVLPPPLRHSRRLAYPLLSHRICERDYSRVSHVGVIIVRREKLHGRSCTYRALRFIDDENIARERVRAVDFFADFFRQLRLSDEESISRDGCFHNARCTQIARWKQSIISRWEWPMGTAIEVNSCLRSFSFIARAASPASPISSGESPFVTPKRTPIVQLDDDRSSFLVCIVVDQVRLIFTLLIPSLSPSRAFFYRGRRGDSSPRSRGSIYKYARPSSEFNIAACIARIVSLRRQRVVGINRA